MCVPGRSFKSLSEKDIKVLHVEPRVRDAILNVGIIDILQMYSAPKRLERVLKVRYIEQLALALPHPSHMRRGSRILCVTSSSNNRLLIPGSGTGTMIQ